MASNASKIEFANWKPPPIESLDFSSNCTVTKAFLESWFDLSLYEDVGELAGHSQNVTFWVPESLHSQATENHFRLALPLDIRQIPSYGEILLWEYSLRTSYAESVHEWVASATKIEETTDNRTEIDQKTDRLPLDTRYFNSVIQAPSLACKKEICDLGFEWGHLGDVNGPGIFIYYILLLCVSVVYSLIALVEASRQLGRSQHQHQQIGRPKKKKSTRPINKLYQAAKESFSGFSDAAAVFSFALPFAIIAHYFTAGSPIVTSKDIALVLWILAYSSYVSVWLYRIGACIRRVERAKAEAEAALSGQKPQSNKKYTLATAVIIGFATPGLVVLLVAAIFAEVGDYFKPFKFEEFWDGICSSGHTFPQKDAYICIGCLVAYCLLRTIVVDFVLSCLSRRERKRVPQFDKSLSREQRKQRLKLLRNIYSFFRRKDPRYRKATDVLGMLDIVILGVGSGVILRLYWSYRMELSETTGVHPFKDNWGLGQVLALSTLIPVMIGFCHIFSS
nr:uncharacterized protein CTRU02_14398 [Colletotrichum truncatum]KAF6782211.1 hypothetical protein CTRU02_14398 [Colletotrichum truncatum]